MENSQQNMFSVLLIICSLQLISTDEVSLHVLPPNLAVQAGQNGSLKCYHAPENLEADNNLDWYLPQYNIPISKLKDNKTVINETQSAILRYISENGTLTIVDATKEDAGTFICKNSNSTLTVESIFKVYVMPSYFTEAMVVIGINAVLLLIFIGCYIWRTVHDIQEKKEQQETRRKAKLGHRKVAKKLMA